MKNYHRKLGFKLYMKSRPSHMVCAGVAIVNELDIDTAYEYCRDYHDVRDATMMVLTKDALKIMNAAFRKDVLTKNEVVDYERRYSEFAELFSSVMGIEDYVRKRKGLDDEIELAEDKGNEKAVEALENVISILDNPERYSRLFEIVAV